MKRKSVFDILVLSILLTNVSNANITLDNPNNNFKLNLNLDNSDLDSGELYDNTDVDEAIEKKDEIKEENNENNGEDVDGENENVDNIENNNDVVLEDKATLKTIIDYTYNYNDTLNAMREKTKSIETLRLKTLGENALPEIGIDLNYGYIDLEQDYFQDKYEDDGKLENHKIYLQQPIFKSGRTYNKLKVVDNQIEMQQNTLLQTEQEVLYQAINATMQLIQTREILAIAKKNEEGSKHSYEYVKAKKKVGRATITDLSLAEARYSLAKSDTIVASTNYLNAKSNFLKITKINPNFVDVDFNSIFADSFAYDIDFDQLIEKIFANNPQFKIAQSNYQMNRSNLNYAKTSFLPELYLNAEYGKQATVDIQEQTAASVSLNLKVPLFQSGTEYAQHREAGYLLNETKFNLNSIKDTLTQDAINVYDTFLSSKNLIVSTRAYRDAAKIAMDGTIAQERVGKSTIVDVLDRRREYFDTEIEFLKNKTNVIMQYFTLQMLMGELTMENITQNYE